MSCFELDKKLMFADDVIMNYKIEFAILYTSSY